MAKVSILYSCGCGAKAHTLDAAVLHSDSTGHNMVITGTVVSANVAVKVITKVPGSTIYDTNMHKTEIKVLDKLQMMSGVETGRLKPVETAPPTAKEVAEVKSHFDGLRARLGH